MPQALCQDFGRIHPHAPGLQARKSRPGLFSFQSEAMISIAYKSGGCML
jgi:hypothetical protein